MAYSQLLTYVGVPESLQERMTPQEKVAAKKLIDAILPISQKVDGGIQEAVNMANMKRLALESTDVSNRCKGRGNISRFKVCRGGHSKCKASNI